MSPILRSSAGAVLAALAGTACNSGASREDGIRAQRLAQIEEISRLCSLPRSALTLGKDDRVNLKPINETPYQAVSCALEKLEAAGLLEKVGLVSEPPPKARN